jgi:hypothetical protein
MPVGIGHAVTAGKPHADPGGNRVTNVSVRRFVAPFLLVGPCTVLVLR